MIDTGVCEKTLLRRRRPFGQLAWKTPNRGLESSFCRWIAWQGLAQKECVCSQTPVAADLEREQTIHTIDIYIYIYIYYINNDNNNNDNNIAIKIIERPGFRGPVLMPSWCVAVSSPGSASQALEFHRVVWQQFQQPTSQSSTRNKQTFWIGRACADALDEQRDSVLGSLSLSLYIYIYTYIHIHTYGRKVTTVRSFEEDPAGTALGTGFVVDHVLYTLYYVLYIICYTLYTLYCTLYTRY